MNQSVANSVHVDSGPPYPDTPVVWKVLLDELSDGLAGGAAVLATDLTVIHCTEVFANLFSSSVQDLCHTNIAQLLPSFVPLIRRVQDSGEPFVQETTSPIYGKSAQPLGVSCRPLRDGMGEVNALLLLVSSPHAFPVSPEDGSLTLDTGPDALRLSEEHFRQVVEAAPDGLALIDRGGRIVLVNTGMERMFGYTRDEMVGRSVEMLMPERYRKAHKVLRSAYMVAPTTRDMASRRELCARRKDGSEFPVEIGLNALQTYDGTHALATIFDVTKRKADQAMIERALAEKTALLNEVHHRVKNNLQVISSLLSLQSRNANSEVRAVLAESQSRVKAMALIHQLLYERSDFSRVDLGVYLQRLCSLLRDTFTQSRTHISLKVQRTDAPVSLDLQRAVPCGLLVNELITNAIKHAFPNNREGRVTVSLESLQDGSGRIVVADDGVGIPADIQLGKAKSLGFQLIPLLVDQLGGTLDMRQNGGTHFELSFRPEGESV